MPVRGHDTRVLPQDLVPVPGHGAQISARALTKGYVQTDAHAWAPNLNRALVYSPGDYCKLKLMKSVQLALVSIYPRGRL